MRNPSFIYFFFPRMFLKFLRSRIAQILQNLNLKTKKKKINYFSDNNFNLNQKLKQENNTCQQKVGQLRAENSEIETKRFPSALEAPGKNWIPESER